MPVPLHALIVADVPVLLAVPAFGDAPWPTVLWYHGFRADALAHAAELERCAEAGFLAVGVDAVAHGARRDHALAERIATTEGSAMSVMLSLVDESLRELPALISALVKSHNADAARISLVGISMGAFLAYRAISSGLPLRAVVALLGSPEQAGANSPHDAIEAFGSVALLSVVAEHDASVSPAAARAFHDALATRYADPNLHRHHLLRGAGHLTNAIQWEEAMRMTMDWLDTKAR